MDCEAALHWTRANIHNFDGDPGNITIMGQSSGATMVWGLLGRIYPYNRPFDRAIALSGGPNVTMVREVAEQQNRQLIDSVGCGGSGKKVPAADVVACLRSNVSAAALSYGHPPINTTWQEHDSLTWGIPKPAWPHGWPQPGVVVIDGDFLVQSLEASVAAGVNADVDLLVSNMAEECDLSPNEDFSHNTTDAPFRGTYHVPRSGTVRSL